MLGSYEARHYEKAYIQVQVDMAAYFILVQSQLLAQVVFARK